MKAHYDAVNNQLNANSALSGKGHDSALVDVDGLPIRATYWILFGGAPDELDDHRLTAQQSADSDAVYVYTVRCVSATADGVRAVVGKVMTQLIRFVPMVAGRNCSAIRMTDASDPEPDNSITPPLFFSDLVFELGSSRA